MRREEPGRRSSGALACSGSGRWRAKDLVPLEASNGRINGDVTTFAKCLENKSSDVECVLIATNSAWQTEAPQLRPLTPELPSLLQSIGMPWQCAICVLLPQSEKRDGLTIDEQRRSQLAASVWTVASSNRAVTRMDFLIIIRAKPRKPAA